MSCKRREEAFQFSFLPTAPGLNHNHRTVMPQEAAQQLSCSVRRNRTLALVNVSIWLVFVPGVVFIQFANSKWQQDEIVKSV